MKSIVLFPLIAIIFTIIAYFFPAAFTPYKTSIIPLLGIVMFGMGMSLSFEHFITVFKQPKIIAIGLFLQFSLMPLLAYLLAQTFSLPLELMVGLVLVGTCPGGTASNVVCYLAKGDVALSIVLTTASTILAMLLTPWLTWFYIGQMIHVPILDMMKMIMMIILLPVSLGILINRYFGKTLFWLRDLFPVISMMAIVLIIAIIVALNHAQIKSILFSVMIVVVLHNFFGLFFTYYISRLLGHSKTIAKTLAIEVGMQNSGLAVALASKFFPAMATIPAVVFSIWHNISGACLASYWSNNKKLQ